MNFEVSTSFFNNETTMYLTLTGVRHSTQYFSYSGQIGGQILIFQKENMAYCNSL